jgi:hypothetical protein
MVELTQTQQLEATQEIIDRGLLLRSSTLRSFSKAPQIMAGPTSDPQSTSKSKGSLPSSSIDQTTLTQSSISGMQIETQMLRDMMLGGETGDTEMLGTLFFQFSFL